MATAGLDDADRRAGSGSAVLSVRGLRRSYTSRGRTTLANAGIDLDVAAGEIVAILGPNGAGKTTLLRQIAGQLRPSAGSIRVGGIDMVATPLRAKELASVIPQECQPRGNLTVEEHLAFFARLKGVSRRASVGLTDELLRRTGLEEHRQRLVRDLSGGLQRRVLIGVALAGPRMRLLLLDEPTTGVDPEARRSVWQLIDELRARGVAILLTTHYIEEAEFLADRVAIVDAGRIAALGTVDEIRRRLPFRGRLEIRGVDRLPSRALERVRSLERQHRVSLKAGSIERLAVPDPFAPQLVREVTALGELGVVASLQPVSLEDAYLELVGAPKAEAR